MLVRLSKTALVSAAGLYLLVVVFNNLMDYGSNYTFVRHVLAMDTTFPDNRLMWRSIHSPWVYDWFYFLIIVWEFAAAVLLCKGARTLWVARRAPAAEFNRAKQLAVLGLTVSLLQWLVAFLTVGGEWFLMWQSKWNGQDAASRMFLVMGVILLFLNAPDEELAHPG